MFARKLSLRAKLEMFSEFTKVFEREIVPLLRRQKGFRDEIVLASPGSRDVLVLSFWETSEDADDYHNSAYRDALAVLAGMIEPGPRIGLELPMCCIQHWMRIMPPFQQLERIPPRAANAVHSSQVLR